MTDQNNPQDELKNGGDEVPYDQYRVKNDKFDGWSFPEDISSNTLEELGVPSLLIRTRYRSDHSAHYSVNTYDNFSLGSAPVSNLKSVGMIENDEPSGRILFKKEFIAQYPQLQDVTVYRLGPGVIRFIRTPLTNNSFEQVEAARKAASKAKAAATRAAKKAAAAKDAESARAQAPS